MLQIQKQCFENKFNLQKSHFSRPLAKIRNLRIQVISNTCLKTWNKYFKWGRDLKNNILQTFKINFFVAKIGFDVSAWILVYFCTHKGPSLAKTVLMVKVINFANTTQWFLLDFLPLAYLHNFSITSFSIWLMYCIINLFNIKDLKWEDIYKTCIYIWLSSTCNMKN